RAHDRAHGLVARDDGDHPVDVGLADRGGHVGARDPHPALLIEGDRVLVRELAKARAVGERQAALQREPGERAVHRTRVQVAEAEPLRELLGDRALAGAGRPVYGDDHRCVTESSSSKNPGKLTATASGSRSSTPSRETSPATPPSIAIRWSPSEPIPPPFGREGTPLTPKPS